MRCSAAGSSPGFPDGPAALADATIYLPTRRATRALVALLAERGGARAQLLPRIVPLGEADEAEFELTAGAALEEAEVLAPPIPPLERRLILTRLVQRWSKEVDRNLLRLGPGDPVHGAGLARRCGQPGRRSRSR